MTETVTATTGSGTGSRWNSSGSGTGVGSSNIPVQTTGGAITLVGFGEQKVARPGGAPSVKDYTAYSSSDINAVFDAMVFNKDTRLSNLMKQLGVTDVAAMKKIWRKAATTASSIAKTGQAVDFFSVLVNPSTYASTQKISTSANTIQPYQTNFFDKNGKATPAAQELLKSKLTDILGHVPSAEEVKEYQSVLTDMSKQQSAGLFKTTVNNKTGVTTPGVDPSSWLTEQIANKHQARIQYGKETAQQSNIDQFNRLAAAWGYKGDTNTLISQVEAKKLTLDDVQNQFRNAVLASRPYLKPQFDAGLTLQDVASPAIKAISSILERDENSITPNDVLVQKYLDGIDRSGVMPMYKYEAMLRQDPSWQYTKNAHATFADLATQIGQKFGMVG